VNMSFLPTIPINFLTFLLLSLFWGGVSFAFTWKTGDRSREFWVLHVLTGVLASLASLLLLTAAGFIPDDWNANRMAVPLSLLYGYPLYSSLESDPSNCNFYLPLGFLGYLPAALLGFFFESPSLCLFLGWITTLVFYFFPFLLLLVRLKTKIAYKIIFGLIVIVISLSIPALRYVATMIHVDALGIFLIGSATVLLLPLQENNSPSKIHLACAGICLCLSFFVKQTFLPLSTVIILMSLFYYRSKILPLMLFASISFFILFVIVYLTVDRDLVLRYAFKASSSVPTALSITQSATTFLSSSWPLWISTVSLSAFIVFRRSILNKTSEIALLLLVFITFPLAIYTFTKAGADVNHFVLPLYLLLIANICLLCKITISSSIQNYTKLVILFIGFIFSTPFAISYLKTNCGWYLWIKNRFFTEFCGWGGRVVRKRRDGSTRSNSLRTLWKNARTYRRLEGLRGGFATGRQALGVAIGLGEERGDLPGMWCEHEPA